MYEGLVSVVSCFGEGHPRKSSSEPSLGSWSQNLADLSPYEVLAVELVPSLKTLDIFVATYLAALVADILVIILFSSLHFHDLSVLHLPTSPSSY